MGAFIEVCSFISRHIPGFEIRYKNESWSSKVIAALVWIFNRRYMQEYTTTRYPRVYFPSRAFVEESPNRATKILLHEFVHLWDRQNEGFMFVVRYALPQLLAMLNFLFATIWLLVVREPEWAQWTFAGLGFGVGVLCVLPLPSKSRSMIELRGYSMNVAANYWRYDTVQKATIEWIAGHFVGWEYYKMWPWRRDIDDWLLKAYAQIRQSLFGVASIGGRNGRPFQLVHDLFEREGWRKNACRSSERMD